MFFYCSKLPEVNLPSFYLMQERLTDPVSQREKIDVQRLASDIGVEPCQ